MQLTITANPNCLDARGHVLGFYLQPYPFGSGVCMRIQHERERRDITDDKFLLCVEITGKIKLNTGFARNPHIRGDDDYGHPNLSEEKGEN